jgi:hypothetical protein
MRPLLGRRPQPSAPVAPTPVAALEDELAQALGRGDLETACALDRVIEARKREIDQSRREAPHG